MRLVVLTCSRQGTASRILPHLLGRPELDVAGVVLAHGVSSGPSKRLRRRLAKTCRIGVLGALNGVRMRAWYREPPNRDLGELCHEAGIPFHESPFINCDETVRLFRDADADLGLSLGNGYIAERVFTIPCYGMINLHSEVLPRFQGAQSVIWPIYEGIAETGFTIHQVNRKIDGGDILRLEKWPIIFRDSLRATVEANLAHGRELAGAAMAEVCVDYRGLRERAVKQAGGRSYTTPTFWQYLRMVRNHARLRATHAARGPS